MESLYNVVDEDREERHDNGDDFDTDVFSLWYALLGSDEVATLPVQLDSDRSIMEKVVYLAVRSPFNFAGEPLNRKSFLPRLVEGFDQTPEESEYLLFLLKSVFNFLGEVYKLVFSASILPKKNFFFKVSVCYLASGYSVRNRE